MAEARFFATPGKFRKWLQANHAKAPELVVGYWKVGSGKPSISWSESVDEAICFGWIDGVRRSLDAKAYTVRFTPRRPGSTWSKVNVAKAEKALAEGRMAPAGLAAFHARKAGGTGIYAFEQGDLRLPPDAANALKADKAAWAYWRKAPPSYRKAATWWLLSAKREATKAKRLAELVRDAAAGKTVRPLTPRKGKR